MKGRITHSGLFSRTYSWQWLFQGARKGRAEVQVSNSGFLAVMTILTEVAMRWRREWNHKARDPREGKNKVNLHDALVVTQPIIHCLALTELAGPVGSREERKKLILLFTRSLPWSLLTSCPVTHLHWPLPHACSWLYSPPKQQGHQCS